jgi:hypothetical protein
MGLDRVGKGTVGGKAGKREWSDGRGGGVVQYGTVLGGMSDTW